MATPAGSIRQIPWPETTPVSGRIQRSAWRPARRWAWRRPRAPRASLRHPPTSRAAARRPGPAPGPGLWRRQTRRPPVPPRIRPATEVRCARTRWCGWSDPDLRGRACAGNPRTDSAGAGPIQLFGAAPQEARTSYLSNEDALVKLVTDKTVDVAVV